MTDRQADPLRTYAVVVGIDKYDIGSNWDLDGPANDAFKFVAWLIKQQVPANQIFTFASTDEAQLAAFKKLKVTPSPAKWDLIRDILTNRLAGLSGDLLCFYWAGHGVIDALGNRRLYCADATLVNPLHISLSNLLASWRTNIIGNFPLQIGFVDACANYMEFYRTAASMPANELPIGVPTQVEQFFLLAASAGEVAKNLSDKKSGAFSEVLFERLGGMNTLPPPMQELNEGLLKQFAELRDSGKAEQTPSHVWYREWQGTEGTLGTLKRPAQPALSGTVKLSNDERDEVVQALLGFDVMANPEERRSIIADLRREIKFNYRSSSIALMDVNNLVRTSLSYPYGLQELIRVVERFKGANELEWQNLKQLVNRLKIDGE
jgi:hypothetical protein